MILTSSQFNESSKIDGAFPRFFGRRTRLLDRNSAEHQKIRGNTRNGEAFSIV
jgi:hypothetical protein